MVSNARRRIVYKAIRAAILKGTEIEYWALRMYDQQAAGVLTDAQVAELEELIEAYYDEEEPQDPADEQTDEQGDEQPEAQADEGGEE